MILITKNLHIHTVTRKSNVLYRVEQINIDELSVAKIQNKKLHRTSRC